MASTYPRLVKNTLTDNRYGYGGVASSPGAIFDSNRETEVIDRADLTVELTTLSLETTNQQLRLWLSQLQVWQLASLAIKQHFTKDWPQSQLTDIIVGW